MLYWKNGVFMLGRFCAVAVLVGALGVVAAGIEKCPQGDIDGDCLVNFADVHAMAAQWLDEGCAGLGCADIGAGAGVDFGDLALLRGRWGDRESPLVISEFMAGNSDSLNDYDGESSDWIEIYNRTSKSVPVTGWYLTDDPNMLTKWEFPDRITVGAGQYLVVFASEKNGMVGTWELHTNFMLNKDGEYLALVEPDGVTIASEYGDPYPCSVSCPSVFCNMAKPGRSFVLGLRKVMCPQPLIQRDFAMSGISMIPMSIQRRSTL